MARAMGYPTDASLAEALEISPSTILRWRRGSRPSVEHLAKLSGILGVRLEGLLALAGHVSPGVFDTRADLPEPPSPITETVRRITDSPLSDESKDALIKYWNERLAEERALVYELIRILDGAERGEVDVVDDLATILRLASQPELSSHLVELLKRVTGILHGSKPRSRRRRAVGNEVRFVLRPTAAGRVRFEVINPDGSIVAFGDEFDTSEDAVRQLERHLGVELDDVQLLREL
ncbi:helix-turn-helix transcriptional regulator [Nonomuraea sp. NPDC005650]|uniref:helix-turn-helix domain-containing protein n=1 Tax=Nonomuraea sp. NPDC005650 TaxID=3157045 RepID=UPI0033B5997F